MTWIDSSGNDGDWREVLGDISWKGKSFQVMGDASYYEHFCNKIYRVF